MASNDPPTTLLSKHLSASLCRYQTDLRQVAVGTVVAIICGISLAFVSNNMLAGRVMHRYRTFALQRIAAAMQDQRALFERLQRSAEAQAHAEAESARMKREFVMCIRRGTRPPAVFPIQHAAWRTKMRLTRLTCIC